MTEEEFLRNYDSNKFFKPSVTVDSILFTIRDVETTNYRKLPEKKLQVLLVKRAEHPYLGKWCLPGTFVRKEERFEEAVQRSLKAKTNMQDIYLEQLYSWGEPSRDPRTRIISTSYMGLVDSERINIKSGGTTQDASWFTISLNTINEKTTENIHGYKKEEEARRYLLSHASVMDTQISREIDYCLFHYHNLIPRMLLSYDRAAFYAMDNPQFRITFDENILWRDHDVTLTTGIGGTAVLPADTILMEVKTADAIPLWLVQLLSREKIYKTSFSKYGTAWLQKQRRF